ncbi:DUF5667 domain-containing protein [Kitasatospora sp. GP82]|uniref:DUF5667 domain-containing protein n=1 Tax=Kitasatospora sp. GP82 TaxID=3035089 RepID=UPI00247455FA|nr:DUF5667 domain-containing protein [Kitasatospora sp. GP82]MDH6124413.1 hypothetical protein [Kitasatospora sp. GP82]
MTANVLEHRRARAFAEALEARQAETRADSSPERGSTAMAELLSMAEALGSLPTPELSSEARTLQRTQLMAAFEREWAGGTAQSGGPAARVPQQRRHRAVRAIRGSRWGRRLAIGGLVAGVAVGSFAGVAAASSNALPGDALYGMKRGLEGLRLDWAGSDAERGSLLLDQASARLEEAQSLLGRTSPSSALSPGTVDQLRRALDDMHAEAIRGRELLRSVYRSNGSLAPMRTLAIFADGEDGRWAALQGRLPQQLTSQASKVDELFNAMSEDVAPLHLEPQSANGTAGSGSGSPDGWGRQAPGSSAADPASGGTPQGSANRPNSPGSSNTGTGNGGSKPSTAPGAVGGLVDELTNGLTGHGSSGTAPGRPDKSAGTPAPSQSPSSAADGKGINLPPLVPGLLPGLTLG